MIAVRDAIGGASKRPWVCVVLLLLVAILLVFVALHGVEHALEGGDVLLCIAVATVGLVFLGRNCLDMSPIRIAAPRDPPILNVRLAVSAPATYSPPLRT